MVASTSQPDQSRGESVTEGPLPVRFLRRLRQHAGKPASESPQDSVQTWKHSWDLGARARWTGNPAQANPYPADSRRARAWAAGWRWAEQQPDRRATLRVRLAHPHRRRTDTPSALLGSARTAGVGVSMLILAAWLWQIGVRRRAAARSHPPTAA